MTLVWHDRGDGCWEAPAASFRDKARWIEVTGHYVIRQLAGPPFDTDYREAGRRFSTAYQNGESITVLGVRRTLGGAHVLADAHYGALCAACDLCASRTRGEMNKET